MVQVESAFRLIQLIALALPAIALYLMVLTNIYSRPSSDTADAVALSYASREWDFALGLAGLGTLLLSAILLMLSTLSADHQEQIQAVGVLAYFLGVLLLVIGLISLFLAVVITFRATYSSIREAR